VLADGTGAGLADSGPPRNVDLLQAELEDRAPRDGLDHAADSACLHDGAEQRSVGRVAAN
jgi:hypothetical protein